MSHQPSTAESEVVVSNGGNNGEWTMVLRELTRLGKSFDLLAQEMREGLTSIRTNTEERIAAMRVATDDRVGKIEERLRAAELELAKVTVKIGLAASGAALLGAALVELITKSLH